ncbi:MAG: Flp pilus assembly protein CpaB [Saccharofermentanales bacterium]
MKKKNQILLTCGISVLIFLILFYFMSKSAKENEYDIFLLNRDINAGEKIEKTMLTILSIPQSSILPNAYKDINEIIGKFVLNDMKKGDMLSKRDLINLQNGIIYPALHKGNVLYTISLKAEDANGWWLAKGNKVQVFIGKDSDDPVNSPEKIESAKIIRIMDESGAEINQDLIKEPKMVCLEVKDEEAKILFKAEGTRKIKLIALNP